MVRGNRKSGGGSCCRGQRGGDAHRRQCGSGRKRQSAGDHCNGGHATTQSGGNANRRQCGSGHGHEHKMRGGKHCNGGHATTQSGGDAHRRQCGSGRKGKRGTRGKGKGKGKGKGRSRSRSRGKGRRASRKMGGSKRTYSVRGGACNASSVNLGHTLDLSDNIRGRAAVVRQRGGDAHGNLRYDCKQPDWGPECR